MSLRVHFLAEPAEHLATYRLRVKKPMELLAAENPQWVITEGLEFPEADVYVLSKHFYMDAMTRCIEHAKKTNAKIVYDVSTDHFVRPERDFIKKVIAAADVVTCCSEPLIKRIKDETGRDARWVKDCISVKRGHPGGDERRGLLWYGHSSNYAGLLQWLPFITEQVTVISNQAHPSFDNYPNVSFVPFSETNLNVFLSRSDIVLNAYDATDPVRLSSSTNRVVDALWAGCVPLVNDVTIYKEFCSLRNVAGKSPLFVVKDPSTLPDIIQGIRLLHEKHADNPDYSLHIAQDYINDNYGDHVIVKQWHQALTS